MKKKHLQRFLEVSCLLAISNKKLITWHHFIETSNPDCSPELI